MKGKLAGLFIVFSLVGACGQSISTSSIPVSPTVFLTNTALPTSTETSVPTISPSLTPTQFPPLSETGPYLLIRQDTSSQDFYIYDVDRHGRRIISLPQNGHVFGRTSTLLSKYISPDGKWMAYYSGSIDDSTLPLTLHLLNINDGTSKKIADVVTDGYEQKLDNVAAQLKQLFPDIYKPDEDGKDWVGGSVANEFTWSIYSSAWSPDSRYLAFAAQIDGMSSDVYVFDVINDSVHRVEDSIQSVSSIRWSPDNKYIVFKNSIPGMIYTGSSLYAVKPDGQAVKNLKLLASGTWLGVGEWLSPRLLLLADGTDTAGYSDLYTLDIVTGQTQVLWGDSWMSYEIDYENKVIALVTSEFSAPENFGFYYITFDGVEKRIYEGLYWISLFFRGGEKHRFLIIPPTDGWDYLGTKESEPIQTSDKIAFFDGFDWQSIHISPDYSWLLMKNNEGFQLFDINDELVRSFKDIDMYDLIWTPDSQGFFYSTGTELYFLSMPNGQPVFVDKCFNVNCQFNIKDAVWLP